MRADGNQNQQRCLRSLYSIYNWSVLSDLCSLCLQVQDFSFQHRKVAVGTVDVTVSSVSVYQRCYWLDGESAACVPDGRRTRPRRRWCFDVIIVFLILQSILIIFLFFKGASVQAFVLKHKTKNLKTHHPGARQGRLTRIPTLKPSVFILREPPPLLLKRLIPVNICSHSVFLTYLSQTIVFTSLSLYFLCSTVATWLFGSTAAL